MIGSRATWLTLCTTAVLIALSGCMSPASKVEATLSDGAIVFLDCEDALGIDTIRASVAPSTGGAGREVWLISGQGNFGPDTPITYGVTPAGFAVETGPKPIELDGTRVSIVLSGFAGGVRYSDVLNVVGEDMHEGLWLDNLGNLNEEPCR